MLNLPYNKQLSPDQVADMDQNISRDEIRIAVWNCGEEKSLGPDGYTFEFFRKYWSFVGPDFCVAVEHFFDKGVMVGDCMSRETAWVDTVHKLRSRLSNWKVKTLSTGGRLTLLKSVLGASPLYNMSIYKVPRGVLKVMEAIRSKFFNGADQSDRKITWVAWDKVLASKKNGGLGVSSFHALNRALLLKWVWRFISQDGSLWFRVIQALHGPSLDSHSVNLTSNWCTILREVNLLQDKGFDFFSHCKKRVGDGHCTQFWGENWICEEPLRQRFPRLFALELDKVVSVAAKLGSFSVDDSFRRFVRDEAERQQWDDLCALLEPVSLSPAKDRWICDLTGDGEFRVKKVRNSLDDLLLPSQPDATRWVKCIPIKINVFVWRARLDCLDFIAVVDPILFAEVLLWIHKLVPCAYAFRGEISTRSDSSPV
ncbi:hypothetical protein Tco_0251986 [Tanacetum coccineum]